MPKNNVEIVVINGKEYPKWAVQRAEQVVNKYGGSLEAAILSVLRFAEAKAKGQIADPNQPGKGSSRRIGGYVVIRGRSQKDENHGA